MKHQMHILTIGNHTNIIFLNFKIIYSSSAIHAVNNMNYSPLHL